MHKHYENFHLTVYSHNTDVLLSFGNFRTLNHKIIKSAGSKGEEICTKEREGEDLSIWRKSQRTSLKIGKYRIENPPQLMGLEPLPSSIFYKGGQKR